MTVNIFNPEWSESEKNAFFSIMLEKISNPEHEIKKHVQINKKLYFSSCGKSSLYAILKANNIGHNDEVILPCYCCETVAHPIKYLHAMPILADIDISDLNISLDSILQLVTPKTKAIIVPSMYGNPANIIEIKNRVGNDIIIINDLAQGYGATLNGLPMESFGDAGFISCGPGKQLAGAGGSVYWFNNCMSINYFKNQNILVNRIFHKLYYYTRVNIDRNYRKIIHNIALRFYWLLNQNIFRVNKSATNLDINVMLMLMENYYDKLKAKKNFICEIDNISKGKTYRFIKEQRGNSSPVKIVLLFDSVDSCNAAKKILTKNEVYYSTGYTKIKGIERITLNGYNQILNKILEIPLEVGKKDYICNIIKKID